MLSKPKQIWKDDSVIHSDSAGPTVLSWASPPQLIVVPNAGIAAYSSWLPTIELIQQIGMPAIFSDFCEEAANLAAHCIESVTGQPLRLPVQVNPFRQPMRMEDSVLRIPCYSNCFIFGL